MLATTRPYSKRNGKNHGPKQQRTCLSKVSWKMLVFPLPLNEYLLSRSKAQRFQGANNIWYEDYQNSESFHEGYWEKYGKAPYVSPPVRELW
jgi:hypothetical protein